PSVKNDATAKATTVSPRGIGPELTAQDIRFTTKGGTLFAIVLGWPEDGKICIKALAGNSLYYKNEIKSVLLLDSSSELKFTRDDNGLTVTLPAKRSATDDYGIALKIIPKI